MISIIISTNSHNNNDSNTNTIIHTNNKHTQYSKPALTEPEGDPRALRSVNDMYVCMVVLS